MSMSANILRNIVSSIFGVKATEVRLSGEISPEYKGYEVEACIAGYTTSEKVYIFNSKKGFRQVNCVEKTQYYNGGCDHHFYKAEPLYTHMQEGDTFVVIKKWNDESHETSWTLYKAPDFKSHWAKVNADDIQRWEEWLNA